MSRKKDDSLREEEKYPLFYSEEKEKVELYLLDLGVPCERAKELAEEILEAAGY